ncbi:major facilitator superfamily domain-containing protein [Lasiosphaeris hirsuta]|uniref:Major facilitator superfamily domain-containing protein n=1 Tax=Lasiosphaeris hirsuta TaxID=260670 RepID=A0AA39ZSB8_9PEZI|nr:major facilitator superfamily domain-containing protein [Lasiosphaeris hirsuta]
MLDLHEVLLYFESLGTQVGSIDKRMRQRDKSLVVSTDLYGGFANSFGVFQAHYQASLLASYPPSSIAWIGTTQGFLVNVVGLVSGRLYDAGYTKSLVYVGSTLNVVGLVATSFSVTYVELFFSLGVCVGLGSGIFYVPSLAIVATYFDNRKRPLATGVAATGAGVGGVVYPILFRELVNRAGLSWALRSFACFNAGLLIVSCLLVRPLKIETEVTNANPVENNPHSPITETAITIYPKDQHMRRCKKKTGGKRKQALFDKTAFRDRPFILFSMSLLLLWLGVDVPFFFLPSFAQDKLNLSNDWGDYLLAIMNASAIIGRLILGLAAVYVGGAFAIWQFAIGASCILLACWAAVQNLPGIIVFVILYGGLTGGVISLVSAALLVISPNLTLVGTRLGMSGVLAGFGFLIGPPVAGAMKSTSAGYIGQSIFAAATYFAAFGVLWMARALHERGSVEA